MRSLTSFFLFVIHKVTILFAKNINSQTNKNDPFRGSDVVCDTLIVLFTYVFVNLKNNYQVLYEHLSRQ